MTKDFEKYIGKRVWCKTEVLAKDFLRLAHDNGWEWRDVGSLLESTSWEEFKKDTCYFVGENKKITYGSIKHQYTNEFIEYEPLCVNKEVSQEEPKEQIDIIGVLENRNSKLKSNHKIGSRDIANQELKEISACIDNLIPHIREAVEKAKKYDDKDVLPISQEEYAVVLRYINAHINEKRDKLKAIIKKLKTQEK